jgi:hypothetical protein
MAGIGFSSALGRLLRELPLPGITDPVKIMELMDKCGPAPDTRNLKPGTRNLKPGNET